MKSLCLQQQQLQIKEIPDPIPNTNEVLIKVSMAGICNTDLELVKGYMGFTGVLGHEFVGIVVSADDQNLINQRVCVEINFGCGKCDFCNRGLSRHCPNRSVLGILNQNGAFAEYLVAPSKNLHRIPSSVPDRAAVFVEPIAAALEISEQTQIQPNDKIAIIGDGKLGLLICQVLKLTGCEIVLIGKHERKLSLAKAWDIDTIILDDLKEERAFDFVVEVSGSSSGFETAMKIVKPRGTIVLKSTYHGNLQFNAAPIVIDEITILGSRCGPFAPAIRLLQNQLIEVDNLIDDIYPFDRALDAFEHARKRESLKILLKFDD